MTLITNQVDLGLEWKLYANSQACFEALQSGEVDALCGFWDPSGSWMDASSQQIARATSFSYMPCPNYLEQTYVYLPKNGTLSASTFEELASALTSDSKICAVGSPGGGNEQKCANTFAQYGASAVCTGFTNSAFEELAAGNCVAVWQGIPSDPGNFTEIAVPWLDARVTYFRKEDLDVPSTKPAKTTLERAVTTAYEKMIQNGDEQELIPVQPGVNRQGFCLGTPDIWPLPEPADGTDLKAVLDSGKFRCGYVGNRTYTDSTGETLWIDTFTPEATGVVADVWTRTIAILSDLYGTELALEWTYCSDSQGCLEMLYNGETDALCQYWTPGAGFTMANDTLLPRLSVFSWFQCPFIYESVPVIMPVSSGVTDFQGLVSAITSSADTFNICINGLETSGYLSSCQQQFEGANCVGATTDDVATDDETSIRVWAFGSLSSGECSAIYGLTTDQEGFVSFSTPLKDVTGTFFRSTDFVKKEDDTKGSGAAELVGCGALLLTATHLILMLL